LRLFTDRNRAGFWRRSSRLLGDLDLAEEAMHEAFAAALESWPQTGIPDRPPRPWLISTARFKAIDGMRRRAHFDRTQRDFARYTEARINEASLDDEEIEDDRLRLIFTCCHPALPPEGQVALTLREICGLTTEKIARAFLVTPATLAQRIVRAKAVIRVKAIPYQVPVSQELSARSPIKATFRASGITFIAARMATRQSVWSQTTSDFIKRVNLRTFVRVRTYKTRIN
jgi:RNA polymerase sigma factor (sigma-70 family)